MGIDDRERAESNRRALREARNLLDESLEVLRDNARAAETVAAELNFVMAVLLVRRLDAIELLIEADLGPEAQAVARGLVEASLSLSWVGEDEDRALRLRAKGPRDQIRMLSKAKAAGFAVTDEMIAKQDQLVAKMLGGRDLPKVPNIASRAKETAGMNPEVAWNMYVMPFARMSEAVHVDTVHAQHVMSGPDTTPMMLHETVAATSFMLAFIANALDGGPAFEQAVEMLQDELRANVGK